MANYVLQKVMEVDLNHFSCMVVSLQTKQGMGNDKIWLQLSDNSQS